MENVVFKEWCRCAPRRSRTRTHTHTHTHTHTKDLLFYLSHWELKIGRDGNVLWQVHFCKHRTRKTKSALWSRQAGKSLSIDMATSREDSGKYTYFQSPHATVKVSAIRGLCRPDGFLFPTPVHTQERIIAVMNQGVWNTSIRDKGCFIHHILNFRVGFIQILFFPIKQMIKIANWGCKPIC